MQRFETERLLMRPLRAEDLAFYCVCYTDPILMQHIGEPLTLEAAERSFNVALKVSLAVPVHRYTWAIQEKISGAAAGLLAMFCDPNGPAPLAAELGTIMLTQFQNRGFTAEALRELANLAFGTTHLLSLLVIHKTQNAAVTGVMTKLGYMHESKKSADASNTQWVLHRSHWLTQCAAASPR